MGSSSTYTLPAPPVAPPRPSLVTVDPNTYVSKPISSSLDFSKWGGLFNQVNGAEDQVARRSLQAAPEVRSSNIAQLSRIANLTGEINARQSAALESKLNPGVAEARTRLQDRILSDTTGGPSTELSNLWTKLGLENAVATGANTGSGFSRSALADSTRRDYIDDRDKRTAELAGFVDANPRPETGIDPATAASIFASTNEGNASARDAFRQQELGISSDRASSLGNLFQSLLQTASAQKQYDQQATSQYQQMLLNAAIENANSNNNNSTAIYQADRGADASIWSSTVGADAQIRAAELQAAAEQAAGIRSANAATSAASSSSSGATTGAAIGAAGAIIGGVAIAF